VATASLGLAAGSRVPVTVAGAGAAAVRALSPAAWRETVRDRLAENGSAEQIRYELQKADDGTAAQVAIVDRERRGHPCRANGLRQSRRRATVRGMRGCKPDGAL
jgi:uncharacterized Ntn-hydrolase superfamily protein